MLYEVITTDITNNAPKPNNTVPGIAYMARGGSHFEMDGHVVMSGEGAQVVKEPPHWMVMWPFESSTTKLPTAPNPSGVYIMFDGTPYARITSYNVCYTKLLRRNCECGSERENPCCSD